VRENLRAVGALRSFGIKGDDDDVTSFQLLKFVPRKPEAFDGIKPSVRMNRGGSWKFRGLMTGYERFTDKSFCAKLFWLPPIKGRGMESLSRRRARWGATTLGCSRP
jgi:hypothetical protein